MRHEKPLLLLLLLAPAGRVLGVRNGPVDPDIVYDGSERLESLRQLRIGHLGAQQADPEVFNGFEFLEGGGDF